MGQLASFISGPVTGCEMEDGYNKAVVYNNDNTKKAFKDLVQHYCRPIGVDGDLCIKVSFTHKHKSSNLYLNV